MDVPGSMPNNDRLKNTMIAAQAFIDKLLPNGTTKTRIALVTYSTATSIANGFVNATERSSLNTKVENLTANGGTNIQAGMRTARVLIQNSNADIKTIILLWDGDPTLTCAINNLDTETDLVTFGQNEHFKGTKRGIDLNKCSTNTLAGDGSTSFRSRCLYDSENDDNCENKKSYYFNDANAALTESDAAKTGSKAAVVCTVALELTGDAGTFMKDMASAPDHAFATNSNDIDDVYARSAGGISNTVSEGVIYDPIAAGFELVDDVTISRGTSTVNNGLITWTIGQHKSDYFGGTMTYQVRAVDSILGVPSSDGLYPTDGRTYLRYKDNTGSFKEKDFLLPKVDPTFLSLDKILVEMCGGLSEKEKYSFTFKVTGPNGFNKSYTISSGTGKRTVEIYDYGPYTVEEVSATYEGASIDWATFTQTMLINGDTKSAFQLGDNIRGDVAVIITNTDKRQADITGTKTVVDASGDEKAEAGE